MNRADSLLLNMDAEQLDEAAEITEADKVAATLAAERHGDDVVNDALSAEPEPVDD